MRTRPNLRARAYRLNYTRGAAQRHYARRGVILKGSKFYQLICTWCKKGVRWWFIAWPHMCTDCGRFMFKLDRETSIDYFPYDDIPF